MGRQHTTQTPLRQMETVDLLRLPILPMVRLTLPRTAPAIHRKVRHHLVVISTRHTPLVHNILTEILNQVVSQIIVITPRTRLLRLQLLRLRQTTSLRRLLLYTLLQRRMALTIITNPSNQVLASLPAHPIRTDLKPAILLTAVVLLHHHPVIINHGSHLKALQIIVVPRLRLEMRTTIMARAEIVVVLLEVDSITIEVAQDNPIHRASEPLKGRT